VSDLDEVIDRLKALVGDLRELAVAHFVMWVVYLLIYRMVYLRLY